MENLKVPESTNKEISEYLKTMDIKKATIGGLDKESVYTCMRELCELYEKNLASCEKVKEENRELQDKISRYNENNESFATMMMEARRNSDKIMEEAKQDSAKLIEEAHQKVASIMKKGEDDIARQTERNKRIIEKLHNESKKYVNYIEKTKGNLSQMNVNFDELKKYLLAVGSEQGEDDAENFYE